MRTIAPATLDARGLTKEAADLRALPEIVDERSATHARRRLGLVKAALSRLLGFKLAQRFKSIEDPDFAKYQASPTARAVMCASWSVSAARRAAGATDADEDDDADVSHADLLKNAAVYAASAAHCAIEMGITDPDPAEFLAAIKSP